MSFLLKKRTAFDYVNYIVVGLISIICMVPFLYVLSVSFTDQTVYIPYRFYLIPQKFSLEAYKYILSTNSFISALKNTAFITIVGTALSLCFTYTFAYSLTKKDLPFRKVMNVLVVISLVFNPGMIPNYLVVRNFGLINSLWALIIPSLTAAWDIIVVRSFLYALPGELEESAKIDGCTDLGVFFRIIIPLSMASIATFTLFFAVFYWNTYFKALLYINNNDGRTLQVLVKSLVLDSSTVGIGGMAESRGDEVVMPQEVIRLASVVFAMAPILMLYPFLQKYFVKGVMLGSVKG